MLLGKQESYRKGIVFSTLLNIGSKTIGFVNSLLLVYLFGTNLGTDSYFLVVSTLGFISSFLVGIVNYVVIPEAMRVRQVRGALAEQSYINFFFWLFLGIGILLALIVLVSPVFFYSLFSKFTQAQLTEYKLLLLISCLLFPLNLIINLLVLVLSSHKYFTTPMLVALINSIISIVLLLVLKAYFGVTTAVIAFVSGSVINIVWIVLYLVRRLNWNFFQIEKPSRTNWRNIIMMEAILVPVSFRSYVTIYMLSGLGAGIITSYTYGMQIALIPEIMILSQVTAVLAIKYNELSALDDTTGIDKLFQKSMRLLFFGMLPMGILIFLLSPEILQVLFIFKDKSELQSLMLIAAFMSCFAITLPFRALDIMVSTIMTARQKIREGLILSMALNFTIIFLTFWMVKLFGLTGFFYLTVFVYAILMPVFYFFFSQKVLPFIQIGAWVKSSILYFLPLVALTTGLFFIKKYYLVHTGIVLNIIIISTIVLTSVFILNKMIKYIRYSLEL